MRKPGQAALLLCVSMMALGTAVDAQSYPTKAIRMLVGYTPAGPTDLTARISAQYLSETLGQQVLVDNRPGAGGTLAGGLLARAEPDGYTIALGANGEIAIAPALHKKLPYQPLKDFAPISRIGAGQLVLLVHPGVPAKSVSELVALARRKPGAVNFASSGNGSTAHLAAELFKHLSATDLVHISYKGAGPALTDLMGGQVQLLITGYSGAVSHIQSGRLRALGVTGTKRLAAAPNLPTIGETVKGFEVMSWYGIFAPVQTPPAIVALLHRELAAMTKRPQVVERLMALGIEPEGTSPRQFAEQIKHEMTKWAKVIATAGVTAD